MENETIGQDQIAMLSQQIDNGTIPGEAHEAPPVEAEKVPEAERLAAKYAEAARRNAMLRRQKQEVSAPIKEKDAELEKLRGELARLKKFEDISNPLDLLKERGFTHEDLVKQSLNPEEFDTKSELQKMRDEFAEYKKLVEDEKRTGLETQKTKAVEDYQAHLKGFVEKAGEKYELIHTLGHHKDVYDVIEETYNRTGKVISDEEACDLVEAFLDKQLDQLTKINKLKNKITPIREDNQSSDLFRESPTLTNQLTNQSTATKRSYLSEEEELKRAASFIKWNND